MNVKARIRQLVTGLTVPQEYCCVDVSKFEQPLKVIMCRSDSGAADVTDSHAFLGYSPLVIGIDCGIPFEKGAAITLKFIAGGKSPVAELSLVLKQVIAVDDKKDLYLFEGIHGKHSLINTLHQWVNSFLNRLRVRPAGNVGLPGNLRDQVIIAYCVPRKISLVTLANGNLMNLFPTDLHGEIGDGYYASSLRVGGRATDQVKAIRKIAISSIPGEAYRGAYAYGKNHMQNMKPNADFRLNRATSISFNFPLPELVTEYRELTLISTTVLGIHEIHIWRVTHREIIDSSPGCLGHIHQYFLQWRDNHKINTPWFKR